MAIRFPPAAGNFAALAALSALSCALVPELLDGARTLLSSRSASSTARSAAAPSDTRSAAHSGAVQSVPHDADVTGTQDVVARLRFAPDAPFAPHPPTIVPTILHVGGAGAAGVLRLPSSAAAELLGPGAVLGAFVVDDLDEAAFVSTIDRALVGTSPAAQPLSPAADPTRAKEEHTAAPAVAPSTSPTTGSPTTGALPEPATREALAPIPNAPAERTAVEPVATAEPALPQPLAPVKAAIARPEAEDQSLPPPQSEVRADQVPPAATRTQPARRDLAQDADPPAPRQRSALGASNRRQARNDDGNDAPRPPKPSTGLTMPKPWTPETIFGWPN